MRPCPLPWATLAVLAAASPVPALAFADPLVPSPVASLTRSLRSVPLEASELVPLEVELQLSGQPGQLGGGAARARLGDLLEGRWGAPTRSGLLPVTVGLKGSRRSLAPSRGHQLELRTDDERHEVLFYAKGDAWYVASAARKVAKLRGETIELYDADLDGRYAAPGDYFRVGDQAFCKLGAEPLALVGGRLFEIEVDEARGEVGLHEVSKPDWASPEQWSALLVLNERRAAAGIAPVRLDRTKSEGCVAHAQYLRTNRGGPGASLTSIHSQQPDAPGFSIIGLRAARSSGISFHSNAVAAIDEHLRTLLHRAWILGSPADGFGIGGALGSHVAGIEGYTVLWGEVPRISGDGRPLLYPAPGQSDVTTGGLGESPDVEAHPGLFEAPRGVPISVYLGDLRLETPRIELQRLRRGSATAVDGLLFTPDDPVHSYLPDNQSAVFFVATEPLERSARYQVVFTAGGAEGAPIRLVWSFETAGRHPSFDHPVRGDHDWR